MLFHSYVFLFVFLPLSLLLVRVARSYFGVFYGQLALLLTSMIFYGWSHPEHVLLFASSILCNFSIGNGLAKKSKVVTHKWLLLLGIGLNVGILFAFKYFLPGTLGLTSANPEQSQFFITAAPLAISFFTFQQIAYLVDIQRGGKAAEGLLSYSVFISFFPQLVAGPVVKYHQVKDALTKFEIPDSQMVAKGLTLMAMGLAKKLLLADYLASMVSGVDQAIVKQMNVTFIDSWLSSALYSLQIYFDFSGYCDLAVGLGLLFGVTLPLNFNSPYKADSIREFWRRWHMTVSGFFRDYLFLSLGGSRASLPRVSFNILFVMLVAGLWHGLGWTFVVWGLAHGVVVSLEHIFARFSRSQNVIGRGSLVFLRVGLVFLFLTTTWVFFRQNSLAAAWFQLSLMMDPFAAQAFQFHYLGQYQDAIACLVILLPSVFFLPNSQQILGLVESSALNGWRPTLVSSFLVAVVVAICLVAMANPIDFIYFRF